MQKDQTKIFASEISFFRKLSLAFDSSEKLQSSFENYAEEFSRQNFNGEMESNLDEIAIKILADSNIDPHGLVQYFFLIGNDIEENNYAEKKGEANFNQFVNSHYNIYEIRRRLISKVSSSVGKQKFIYKFPEFDKIKFILNR